MEIKSPEDILKQMDEDREIVLKFIELQHRYGMTGNIADQLNSTINSLISTSGKKENKLSTGLKEAIIELDKMFNYIVETFEDKWLLKDDDLLNTIIKTSWTTYDLEAIIEHSIVHILRHRLQIQKLLVKS